MSDPQRREFLAAAAAIASMATLAGTQSAIAGDPSFMNNVPDPAPGRQGAADVQVRAGEVGRQGDRQAASARRRPSSSCRSPRGSPAFRCGSSRARCASCTGTPPPPSGRSCSRAASGPRSSTRRATPRPTTSSPGDVWYFPRGHGHMLAVPGRQAVPLHPDLRQRLLLRVRHVQHHRLDRPHAQGAAGEELRPARVGLRRLPQGRGLLRPRHAAARASRRRRCRAGSCRRRRTSTACWRSRRTAIFKGGREWRVDSSRFPISKTITGVVLDLEPGGAARAALAPERRRVAVRHRGPGQRHPVRLARPLPDRDAGARATSATSRRATGTRSRTSATSPRRVLIGFNTGIYETIDLSQWIAGNPADVLATNFGQPPELFGKFPHRDVFITGKDGPGK